MNRLGLARVWSVDRQEVLGCGFLASPSVVITCTHILKDQGFSDPPAKGSGPITVEFICDDRLPPRQPIERTAHVRVSYRTDDTKGPGHERKVTEDITVLDLDEPLDASDVLTFVNYDRIEALDSHTAAALGFPEDHDRLGLEAKGTVSGANAGWLQLHTHPPIQRHFSGGAVWDNELGAYVGMVMAADDLTDLSFIIPTSYLLAAWPDLLIKRDPDPKVETTRREEIEDRVQTTRLAHLCNRTPQETQIGMVLKKILEEPPNHTVQTFVIHGDNQEAIERFIERLELDALPELLNVQKPLTSRVIEWSGAAIYADEPDRVTSVRNYMKDRAQHHGLDSADRTPMAVEMLILGREFRPGAGAVLREILDFWANFRLPAARHVVVCLGLRYMEPKQARGWFARKLRSTNDEELRGFVDKLKNSLPPNTTVVQELLSVLQGEAEDWTGKVKQKCQISREDVGEIYERTDAEWKSGGPIPMKLLAPELEQLLIRQMLAESMRR